MNTVRLCLHWFESADYWINVFETIRVHTTTAVRAHSNANTPMRGYANDVVASHDQRQRIRKANVTVTYTNARALYRVSPFPRIAKCLHSAGSDTWAMADSNCYACEVVLWRFSVHGQCIRNDNDTNQV